MERKDIAEIVELLEYPHELLSIELDRFNMRPQNIKKARDSIQEILDKLDGLYKKCSTAEDKSVSEQLV